MTFLFQRLKLAHKLLIFSATCALPLGVLLYYTVSGFQRQIDFTTREIAGARALQPLCKLAILFGTRQPDVITAALNSLVPEVRKGERELGPLLPVSVDAAAVYASFQALAENANLILDPDLDSYYLADLTLVRVPKLYETLSENPAATMDARSLDALRRAVTVALAENRRMHPGDSSVATHLPQSWSAFESATAGPARVEALAALWQTGAAELNALLQRRYAALRRRELTALMLTLATGAFAAFMLLVVVRSVSVPLARATRIADKIASGHLASAAQSLSRSNMQRYIGRAMAEGNGHVRDEGARLLTAFAVMANNLNSLLEKVRTSCSEVDGSTSQMAAALHQFEAMFAEQAASTNQVVATSKEIFATVQELAENMHTVTGMAAEAANVSSASLANLNGINAAMQDTLEGAASISAVLHSISAKAANIDRILSTITKIANRTNLISLNAAIEAEKAGDYAAGFAAVGLEIRRVADQTAVATLDIEKMLSEMQAAVSEGDRSMAAYTERSRGNSETVASITADLGHSIECTRNLEPHFDAVNNGMQMQAEAARQILNAMQQLSAAAGQTRDSLAQFREVAEQMRTTVGVLQAEMARFSVA